MIIEKKSVSHCRVCKIHVVALFFFCGKAKDKDLPSIKGGFPQQGPRPTCDCISGPRLIPAVSWGQPAYIMRALRHVGLPISGRCATTPPLILGLGAARTRSTPFGLAPHAHKARPLDLSLFMHNYQIINISFVPP